MLVTKIRNAVSMNCSKNTVEALTTLGSALKASNLPLRNRSNPEMHHNTYKWISSLLPYFNHPSSIIQYYTIQWSELKKIKTNLDAQANKKLDVNYEKKNHHLSKALTTTTTTPWQPPNEQWGKLCENEGHARLQEANEGWGEEGRGHARREEKRDEGSENMKCDTEEKWMGGVGF